jgi:hypothetical protein
MPATSAGMTLETWFDFIGTGFREQDWEQDWDWEQATARGGARQSRPSGLHIAAANDRQKMPP